jgi:hypothetical protein
MACVEILVKAMCSEGRQLPPNDAASYRQTILKKTLCTFVLPVVKASVPSNNLCYFKPRE